MTPMPYSESFITFWTAYPRHVAKTDAWKAFQRLTVDDALLDLILDALDWQRTQPQWTKDRGAFIPYPATWLNGRRWEDEPPLNWLAPPVDWWEECKRVHGVTVDNEPVCTQAHYHRLKMAREAEKVSA